MDSIKKNNKKNHKIHKEKYFTRFTLVPLFTKEGLPIEDYPSLVIEEQQEITLQEAELTIKRIEAARKSMETANNVYETSRYTKSPKCRILIKEDLAAKIERAKLGKNIPEDAGLDMAVISEEDISNIPHNSVSDKQLYEQVRQAMVEAIRHTQLIQHERELEKLKKMTPALTNKDIPLTDIKGIAGLVKSSV